MFFPTRSRRSRWIASIAGITMLATSVLVAIGNGTASAAPAGFLYRNGAQLMLDGRPYKFVGVNAFGIAGCQTGRPYSDEQIEGLFRSLPPRTITRTWAFKPQGLAGIDRAVRLAEKHSQFLMLSFADGAGHCGDSMGRKGGEGTGKTDAFFQSGYKGEYLAWVREVVNRYKTSPAIGMWELMNEPGGANDQAMKSFFDTTANEVRRLDPHHLITTGALAPYVAGTRDYAYVHSGSNIDVVSVHEYDYDHNNSKVIISPWFDKAMDDTRSLKKPVFVGETGIKAADSGCASNYATRAAAFRQKFDSYLAKGAAGVLLWNWFPAKVSGCRHDTFPEDPLMGMVKNYRVTGVPVPTTSSPLPSVPPAGPGAPGTTVMPRPAISLERRSRAVVIVGSGFPPATAVTVRVVAGAGRGSATLTTDSTGSVRAVARPHAAYEGLVSVDLTAGPVAVSTSTVI